MYHYVYMLLTVNSKTAITYVGYSTNPIKRLDRHNRGIGAKFTKGRMWKIIYKKKPKSFEEFTNLFATEQKDNQYIYYAHFSLYLEIIITFYI